MTDAKIQKARVGVAGSFINQIMANNATTPVVGDGATILHYTDRTALEVVEVSADGTEARLQYLQAEWDRNLPGGEGHQNWKLTPTEQFLTVVWRKNGWYSKGREVVFTKEAKTLCEKEGFNYMGMWLQRTRPEIAVQIWNGQPFPQNVVEGYTREKVSWSKVSIVFGRSEYYYDWSF